MGKVYMAQPIDGNTRFFNTKREALAFRDGDGSRPEHVDAADAADECNRLAEEAADLTRDRYALAHALANFYSACAGTGARDTAEGRAAAALIRRYLPGDADAMGIPE